MRFVIAILVLLASLAAIAATTAINAFYQFGQGATSFEGGMRVVAMVVFDVVKAGLPVGMAWWWLRRQWLHLLLGAGMFAFCLAMSLLSALGFYASNHASVRQGREGLTVRYRDVRGEMVSTDKRLRDLGPVRPVAVIEATLQGLRTDRRYATSKECSDATLQSSREFCRNYFLVQGELSAAVEAQRLREQQDYLKADAHELLQAGAEREADPQVAVLRILLPFLGLDNVRLGVDVLPSLLLEFVASFGLLLASSLFARRPREPSSQPGEQGAEIAQPASGERPTPMSFTKRSDGLIVIEGGKP